MTKQEFLDKLARRLRQEMSQKQVMEQVQYYDRYLEERMSQGMSETEAVEELGDPLLIAKTIMDASESAKSHWYKEKYSGEMQETKQSGSENDRGGIRKKISVFLWLLLGILVLGVIFKGVFLVMRLVIPVLFPVIMILMILRSMNKRK